MKLKRCKACEKIGRYNSAECTDAIYVSRSSSVSVKLCYDHSVELFKTGQVFFMGKYGTNFLMTTHEEIQDPSRNYFDFNSFS